MLEPVEEVVYLIKIDAVAKKGEGPFYLRLSLDPCRSPYLGSYHRPIPPPLKCHIHNSTSIPPGRLSSHIEGSPCAHTNYRYLQASSPQSSPFHVPLLKDPTCRKETLKCLRKLFYHNTLLPTIMHKQSRIFNLFLRNSRNLFLLVCVFFFESAKYLSTRYTTTTNHSKFERSKNTCNNHNKPASATPTITL